MTAFPRHLARVCLASCAALAVVSCLAQQDWQKTTDTLLDKGQFQEASEQLSRTLSSAVSDSDQQTLRFEIDRIQRIRKDYSLTEQALFEQLQKRVRNVTAAEFQAWIREGRFDSRLIDGERRFMASSVSNLFFRYPALNPRRLPRKNSAAHDKAVYEACAAIRKAVRTEQQPYVLPKQFEVTMRLEVQPNAAAPGQTIRAWLPVPRRYPFQDGFHLLSSSSPVLHLAPEASPIRSAYLEQPARKNATTEFELVYQYQTRGVRFEVDPRLVTSALPANPELRDSLKEAAHVEFTPAMQELSRAIIGTEKNPYLQARGFYDWISTNIQYSFALEYSTMRNIGEYCRTKRYGDCGQEALLFITLCRLNGIPARWQSGWSIFPDAKTIHDWTEIYVPPYGWIPVDPYMGIWSMQYAAMLKPNQKREIRDFYFGGLDQYRLIANSAHSQDLVPPKRTLRSDNVDFQRGELEAGGRNIYFDQYTYDLVAREIKAPQQKALE